MAARDPEAGHEFVSIWGDRISQWVSQQTDKQNVEDYTQEVWSHLIAGNWMRLLQWNGLYDDDAWHKHSLEGFLHRITKNRVSSLWESDPTRRLRGLDPVEIIDRTTPLGNDPVVEAERSRLILVFTVCAEHFNKRDFSLIMLWCQDHTAAQIAEQLEMNANNVYQRRSYLFRQLHDCFVDKLPEYFRHV